VSAEALQQAIRHLAEWRNLSADEAVGAFDVLMRGEASAAQIAALLMALRVKGETAEELAGAVTALRRAMIPLDYPEPGELVDTCGTGGGTLTTFNISTAAAIVAAGAGVRVAKHGNRSFTSRSGSADVLEALGVGIDAGVDVVGRALHEVGMAFMFAPVMHPAMKHVGPVRRELGVPTIMNLVGPLANPARVTRQVVGVADEGRLVLVASALAALGSVHAVVVHGEPGVDEVSPLGRTRVAEVVNGQIAEWELQPSRFGIGYVSELDVIGGSPAENAARIMELLTGRGSPGAEAAVLLNAAAAIYVSPMALSMEDAYGAAARALKSGAALRVLEKLKSVQARAAVAAQ
jgi:anthranilate phosphoribosyltransferase